MSKLEPNHGGIRMPKEAWNPDAYDTPRVRMSVPTDAEHVVGTVTQWLRDVSIIAACWAFIITTWAGLL